jgi:hypothetical protein
MKQSRNPYSNTKRRKAALAFLASKGITQPRGLYRTVITTSDIPLQPRAMLLPVRRPALVRS